MKFSLHVVIALVFYCSLYTTASADPKSCHLDIATWHKGKPFLYLKESEQQGIYPELFQAIFAESLCTLTITYYPSGRIKTKASRGRSDLTFFPRPLGSNAFIGDSVYLKSNSPKNIGDFNLYKILSPPIFYPVIGLIGLSDSSIRSEEIIDISNLSIGALHVPQRNDQYWLDFFELPSPPISYNSIQQGLKAVAAGRIDAFHSFTATTQDFPEPDIFKLVKQTKALEMVVLIHNRGLEKLSREKLNSAERRIKHLYTSGEIRKIIEKHSRPEHFQWPSLP